MANDGKMIMAINRKRVNCGVGEPDVPRRSVHEFFTEQLRRKFMTLPKAQKDLIREAQAAGFEWRGEDTQAVYEKLGGLTHFEHAYREWQRMRQIGIHEYRKESLAKLHAVTRRLLANTNPERA